jgi:hypothetical protein
VPVAGSQARIFFCWQQEKNGRLRSATKCHRHQHNGTGVVVDRAVGVLLQIQLILLVDADNQWQGSIPFPCLFIINAAKALIIEHDGTGQVGGEHKRSKISALSAGTGVKSIKCFNSRERNVRYRRRNRNFTRAVKESKNRFYPTATLIRREGESA